MEQSEMKQELQKLLVEAEETKRQLDAMREEAQMMEITLNDVNASITAIDSLKDSSAGADILVPIGSAVYVKAQLKDPENVILGVGAGISMEKKIADARKHLDERKKEIEQMMEKLQKKVQELTSRLVEIDGISRSIVSELQRTQGAGLQLPDGQ